MLFRALKKKCSLEPQKIFSGPVNYVGACKACILLASLAFLPDMFNLGIMSVIQNKALNNTK